MTTKLNIPLQEWINANEPKDDLLWKNDYWSQVMFVRDRIATLVSETYAEYESAITVVSEHTSKSIKCPVYRIERGGDIITMRYNFYDWNVSIESKLPLNDWVNDFDKPAGSCQCEGMADYCFGSFKDNNLQFTIPIGDHYRLYTFFYLWRKNRGLKIKD